MPVVLVINKIDRADARVSEVVDEVYELFIDIGADEDQIEFPIVYTAARDGYAQMDIDGPKGTDMTPLFETLIDAVPPASYEEDHPTQVWVTNLDASPYLAASQSVVLCKARSRRVNRSHGVRPMGRSAKPRSSR